jgi:hypothetical protein
MLHSHASVSISELPGRLDLREHVYGLLIAPAILAVAGFEPSRWAGCAQVVDARALDAVVGATIWGS